MERGWYCENGKLVWYSGECSSLSEEEIEAFYYNTPDEFIDWIDEPEHYDWGDTYDIDEDERFEDASDWVWGKYS